MPPPHFSEGEARRIGDALRVDWSRISLVEFRKGLDAESALSLWSNEGKEGVDPTDAGRIAHSRLMEMPDFYSRLEQMEAESGRP